MIGSYQNGSKSKMQITSSHIQNTGNGLAILTPFTYPHFMIC